MERDWKPIVLALLLAAHAFAADNIEVYFSSNRGKVTSPVKPLSPDPDWSR